MGCDTRWRHASRTWPRFNPRTRVGCDGDADDGHTTPQAVSIHAPAWGATSPHGVMLCQLSVSIHAPAWGATRYGASNLRHCIVSIHAPAWGATTQATMQGTFRLKYRFNPRTRVGCDVTGTGVRLPAGMFQSTHPRGVRLMEERTTAYDELQFQSTHPRGVRLFPCFIQ